MHVFFQPDLSQSSIQLNEEESKHCVRVLRLKTGDEVHLADGKGTHAIAVITDDHPKKCILQITTQNQHKQSRNYYLHLMVAPTKNMERIEWFLEKATEAGVDEISFIETANSERSKINMERLDKIAISAMKQSKQWFLPKLNSIEKLNNKQFETGSLRLIAWCETPQTELLTKHIQSQPTGNSNIIVLIGPEGDFTTAEIGFAKQNGFIPSSLGTSILRTETAALYACMAVKALLN